MSNSIPMLQNALLSAVGKVPSKPSPKSINFLSLTGESICWKSQSKPNNASILIGDDSDDGEIGNKPIFGTESTSSKIFLVQLEFYLDQILFHLMIRNIFEWHVVDQLKCFRILELQFRFRLSILFLQIIQ
ncbi:hypothetical protein DERF_009781 [Dermatophagoides farinae]|uniref:Uncharacterized protein n=1 Tax=Dermatophagoides farinae TaxID=6954 RepID=A0A922L1V7_DERFA|nr:hypothetical protein DERF_009781 [Dermatophagoides farinae]